MPTFRCTSRLLKEVGIKPISDVAEHADDWHANLIRIGPKKIVLFCSTPTLYACVTPVVSRAQLRDLETVFSVALDRVLLADGYPRGVASDCLDRCSKMSIAKTSNRSVLGTMTDYLYHIESMVYDAGGPEHSDPVGISLWLNQIPQVRRQFFNGGEAFRLHMSAEDRI